MGLSAVGNTKWQCLSREGDALLAVPLVFGLLLLLLLLRGLDCTHEQQSSADTLTRVFTHTHTRAHTHTYAHKHARPQLTMPKKLPGPPPPLWFLPPAPGRPGRPPDT